MRMRSLGPEGLMVSALGLGCWGMSRAYGPADDAESLATLERALDLGDHVELGRRPHLA
jgi:aryl-alcohol dehydrogenase-like predicted oxidoreductase